MISVGVPALGQRVMKAVADKWQMMEYEVKMFYATSNHFFTGSKYFRLPFVLRNALEESAVLHTRILCDILLSRKMDKDDIILEDLLTGWPCDPRYATIKPIRGKLETLYGNRKNPASPCWEFNKRLMHATSHRGSEYDYRNSLDSIYPLIHGMIRQIETLTKRHFRLKFDGPTNPPTLFWA